MSADASFHSLITVLGSIGGFNGSAVPRLPFESVKLTAVYNTMFGCKTFTVRRHRETGKHDLLLDWADFHRRQKESRLSVSLRNLQ